MKWTKSLLIAVAALAACGQKAEPNSDSAEEARMLQDSIEHGYMDAELSPLDLITKLPHGWTVDNGIIYNKDGNMAGILEPGVIETDSFYSAATFIKHMREGGAPIISAEGDTLFAFPESIRFIDDGEINAPLGTWHYIITQGFTDMAPNGTDTLTQVRYPVHYAINLDSELVVIQLYIFKSLLEEKSLHQRILLNVRGEKEEPETMVEGA